MQRSIKYQLEQMIKLYQILLQQFVYTYSKITYTNQPLDPYYAAHVPS